MKIKLTRLPSGAGGLTSATVEAKVMEWPADQTLPQGASVVPDDQPVSDWHEETP